jgi:predicted flap endonuclease-1-like 5' DNA nuclease
VVYLFLQTSLLLSISAVVFFAVGWMARRWMEHRDPWRLPTAKARRQSEPSETETVQAHLKQASDELAHRNSELKASREVVQAVETKWLDATNRVVELEQVVADQALELQMLRESAAGPDEGIAVALREQLQNLEARIGQMQAELDRFQSQEAAMAAERLEWELKIQSLEHSLSVAQAPKAEPVVLQPLSTALSTSLSTPLETPSEILDRVERLERQLDEKEANLLNKDESLEQELKARLSVLEDTLQNLRAESEMALLAQLEFHSKAQESQSEEQHRWVDLEQELELRITQLERELSGVRQADALVGQISEQVESHLKEQITSLASEVSEMKQSWTHQEVEFKSRDEQILGNLDRLQESLQKLGIRIEEEDSVPESVLREMDDLRGDILASIPQVPEKAALDAEVSQPTLAEAPEVSPAEEIAHVRSRFENASQNLQQLLEEKDRTIRQLDQKLQTMAKKIDPALVGRDDLELIKGIGPYIKRTLEKEFGISSFRQIALLQKGELEKISTRLFFKNKIQKEDWIGQAIGLHLKKYDELLENTDPPYPYQWVG